MMTNKLDGVAALAILRRDLQDLKDGNPPETETYQIRRDLLLDWLAYTYNISTAFAEYDRRIDKITDKAMEKMIQ